MTTTLATVAKSRGAHEVRVNARSPMTTAFDGGLMARLSDGLYVTERTDLDADPVANWLIRECGGYPAHYIVIDVGATPPRTSPGFVGITG